VVDDSYLGVVRLAGTRAYLTPGAAFGKLYYNVTATDGLFIGPNKTLSVRFYKPDNFSLVRASLVSVDVVTGALIQVHFFSSSQYPASVGSFQTQQSVPRNLPEDFDFNAKAYYVEVDLVRLRDASGTPQGDPRIELLQILSH
jgi:hypothetical protein